MNILIVVENVSKIMGGEAQKVLIYLQKLQEKGHDVWLICHSRVEAELRDEFSIEQFNKTRFIKDVPLQFFLYQISLFFPLRIRELVFGQAIYTISQINAKKIVKELIAQQKIHLVFQPTPNTPFAPSALYDLGVPVVIGPLNGGITFPPGFQVDSFLTLKILSFSKILSNILNQWIPGKLKAEKIIVANKRVKELLPKGYTGEVHENIIECGVDLSKWNYSKQKVVEGKEIRFVYVGRLVDWKGVNYLINAFKELSHEIDPTLAIIGDGEEKPKLQKQVNSLGIEDKIEFLGWMDQDSIINYMASCDVFVMPSLRESCGNSILEAMALELPVIVVNWGGPGVIVDSSCGIKIEPSSPMELVKGLTQAMLKLAQSQEMRNSMGKNGRKRIVEQYFDWDAKVDYLIKLFEECVEKRDI